MSRMQRMKGVAGEREAAQLLKLAFPDVARRSAGEESQEDRGRDLNGTPGFCFQVQLAKAPTPEKKLLEALGVAEQDEVAVALTRRSAKRKKGKGVASGDWLATLPGVSFVGIVFALNRAKNDYAQADRARAESAVRVLAAEARAREAEEKLAEAVRLLERGKELDRAREIADANAKRLDREFRDNPFDPDGEMGG